VSEAVGQASDELRYVKYVRVGSAKVPKIDAVRSALAAFVSGVEIEGVAVESGVSEQPVGLDEIALGARNRACRALEVAGGTRCDLALGIEDGLVELSLGGRPEVLNIGCAFVTDGCREAFGLSSGFAYPPDCTAPALAGGEDIGSIFDRVWSAYRPAPAAHGGEAGREPPGAGVGNIGKLTLGALPRSEYGRHAVVCALVKFLHPSLYFGSNDEAPPPASSSVAQRGVA